MKKNDFQPSLFLPVAVCALVIGSVALAGDSDAATATGTANATVVEPVSVRISVPVLSGTIFIQENFTGSLSTSGPLLRAVSPPPSVSVETGTDGGANAQGTTGAQGGTAAQSGAAGGAAPSAANSATVSVARKADGSLSVSGGSNLTFAVSEPGSGAVNIEYN